jgi:EmrB/QacA subfamily drug resistance transporter
MAVGVTAPSVPDHSHDRRWLALWVVSLAQLMIVVDVSVVNVALPTIGADLRLDRVPLTWVVTAYTLCFGGLLLLGGRLADVLGRRLTFVIGVGVFGFASLAAGVAQTGMTLIAARAVQGAGAALVSPAALAIVTTTFDGAERKGALGVWGSVAGAGVAIGVLASGVLVGLLGWRSVFFVNIPIMLAILATTGGVVPSHRPRGSSRRVDVPGALLGMLAIAGLMVALIAAGDRSLAGDATVLPLAAAVGLALLFIRRQRATPDPLVPLRIVASRPLPASLLVMLSGTGLLIGTFFLSSLYLQQVAALSALRTGVTFLPGAVTIILASNISAAAVTRFGPRPVAAVGFAVAAGGLLLLSRLRLDVVVEIGVLPGIVLASAGLGAVLVTASTTGMSRVEPTAAGVTSGVLSTAHEIGASLGVALTSTIIGATTAAAAARGMPPVEGFGRAFIVCAVVAFVAAVATPAVLPSRRPEAAAQVGAGH